MAFFAKMPALGLVVWLVFSVDLAQAQNTIPPPPPPASGPEKIKPPPSDVRSVAAQMSEQVRRLGKDVVSGLEPSPLQQQLSQDVQEIALALDEFQKGLASKPDSLQVRRAYSNVDGSWHHLRGQLVQPGVSTFAMNRALQSIDDLDGRMHKLLGIGVPPADYYGQGPQPTGTADLKRLARTLADRAAYLAGVMQADLSQVVPNRALLVTRAVQLDGATGTFLESNNASHDAGFLQNAFSAVAVVADSLERDLAAIEPAPVPRLQKAWEGFALAELAIRQTLGLPVPPPTLPAGVVPGSQARVQALADQLLGQIDGFLANFAPTARVVPEGGYFLADAQRLRAAAAEFRADVSRGLTPAQLAYEFRDVDLSWQRLARRVARIAQGRTGPNIQRAFAMGDTLAELHHLLVVPGYPPNLRQPVLPATISVGDGLSYPQ